VILKHKEFTMKYKLLVLWLLVFIAGNAMAQEFKIPLREDFLKHTEMREEGYYHRTFPRIRIWGWSRTGKVAYSSETVGEYTGTTTVRFNIFDFINDKELLTIEVDALDVASETGSDIAPNITAEYMFSYAKDKIANALKTHAIVEQYAEFLPFPIKRNDTEYRVAISALSSGEDMWGKIPITKYSATVTANGKRKTILTSGSTRAAKVLICGYFISPFENRALIILAPVSPPAFEGDIGLHFVFSGCHLETGFR